MMREEPSLETLWLKNTRTMDKVQITDRSNTEESLIVYWFYIPKMKIEQYGEILGSDGDDYEDGCLLGC
jgi:hypothetical protein